MQLTTGSQINEAKNSQKWKEMDKSTFTTGDINAPLTEMKRSIRKFSNVIEELYINNNSIWYYISLHSVTEEYTFFSNAHGTFTKTNHVLGY